MSCHNSRMSDGSTLWICLQPIMGFIPEEEWIRRELRLFNHPKKATDILKKRLARLEVSPDNYGRSV